MKEPSDASGKSRDLRSGYGGFWRLPICSSRMAKRFYVKLAETSAWCMWVLVAITPDCDLSGIRVSRDIFAVVNDPQVDIVCELIGGTDSALELVRQGPLRAVSMWSLLTRR